CGFKRAIERTAVSPGFTALRDDSVHIRLQDLRLFYGGCRAEDERANCPQLACCDPIQGAERETEHPWMGFNHRLKLFGKWIGNLCRQNRRRYSQFPVDL